MRTALWTPPAIWTVPRAWIGQTCFVLCGGESLRQQREFVPALPGRVIAVKEGVLLRPNADVLFFAGEKPELVAPPLLKRFTGEHIVVRGRGNQVFPASSKRVWRSTTHTEWSSDQTMVAGYDAGTSAINLAILFGSREIVLLGYDMTGGRWFAGEHKHHQPVIPPGDFERHMGPLPSLASDADRKGIRIINCSPISRVTCFERGSIQDFV